MGWAEPAAWVAVIGTAVALVACGPRIWHSRSWQRARRMGGLGVLDEFYRPAAYEQRMAEQSAAEAGDAVEQRQPRDPLAARLAPGAPAAARPGGRLSGGR